MGRILRLAAIAALLGACTTYRDQLVRSQHAFDQSQNDQALGLLRDLEKDYSSLAMPEQAQYAYLRGMTDYRTGYRADARHWLSIARAIDENSPGVLAADWKTRLGEAMDEMNTVVYDDGIQTLAIAGAAAKKTNDDGAKKKAPSPSPTPPPDPPEPVP